MTTAEKAQNALLDFAMATLAKKKGIAYKHDATGTPTTVYGHGPGGVFTFPGVDPQVFATIIGIEPGIMGVLPKFPSLLTNPVYQTVTGVQADIGDEAVNVCDPVPTAGLTKAGKLTSVFGRYRRQTREIYLNRLGQRNDLADPMNLQLMNLFAPGDDQLRNPDMVAGAGSQVLNNELMKVLFEFGVSIDRLLARQIWTGNPANNTAGEGYKEQTGFELLVGTGKVDAETNVALPSLDSDVKDFNYALVDDAVANIVNVLTYLYRFVRSTARKTGLINTSWVFVMREELFYELTAQWPLSYLTQQTIQHNINLDRLTVDARGVTADRDQMREQQFLLIDGIRVPVILDDGITEETDADNINIQAGEFASDIFLIPLTVLGGTPVTFMEFFQHDNAQIQSALGTGRLANQVWTTNNGAWIWNAERSRLCVFWEGKVEPRLVMRTPQLAGRLQNVRYAPLQHTRQPFPDDPYFVDGGVTTRVGPSYFNEWQT
jgi:hypothetical protein